MKKKITIKSPCSENWEGMDATNSFDARFCQSCQKNVVDFTQKSDLEIARTLKKEKNLCGRFRESQLNREYNLPKDRNSWVIPSALATLLALQTACTELDSQQVGEVAVQTTEEMSCSQQYNPEIIEGISNSNQELNSNEIEEVELGEFIELDMLPPITGDIAFEEVMEFEETETLEEMMENAKNENPEQFLSEMVEMPKSHNRIFPIWLTEGVSNIWDTLCKLF
ncbi:MAG: hypothetical protein ACI85I_001330 [Arenicella sp.]|jgi:hypothetical protein